MPSKDITKTSAYKWAKQQQGKYLCRCGCEKPIKVTWHHWHEGIPNFINGHSNPYIVDLGKGRTKKLFVHGKQLYLKVGRKHVPMGRYLKLARKTAFVYEKAREKELHYSKLVGLLNTIRTDVITSTTNLNQGIAQVNRSFNHANRALQKLRKTIKKMEGKK
jgi:hypothetical protein